MRNASLREKYEADCVRINSYTAQSHLIQGRDLEKVHLKLKRAQQTVQANQRDYANFARALQDTMVKWEQSWKAFCDSYQDMEEDCIEFMIDNIRAYVDAVSTVCVSDDEVSRFRSFCALGASSKSTLSHSLARSFAWRLSSSRSRRTWRTLCVTRALATQSHTVPSAVHRLHEPGCAARLSATARPSTRPTPRELCRTVPGGHGRYHPQPINMTRVGTGAAPRPADQQLQRSQTRSRASSRAQDPLQQSGVYQNGAPNGRITPVNVGMRELDPHADPIDPTAKTMLKVGANACEVNLKRDPQAHSGPAAAGSAIAARVGQDDDPLRRQMDELRNASSAGGGNWSTKTRARNARSGVIEVQ
ncbi:hypothetical protein FKP32DRAFT_1024897 [Trametes sanguinea]|nr:hypothetical protein FKP32DRAFT_1024897 [Trametes sanguinea]